MNADILDNDIAFTVTNSGAVNEGTGTNPTITFTITPSGAIDNVPGSFTYAVIDPTTTTTGADFTSALPSGMLNFASGGPAQTVTVDVVADTIVELDFTLELSTSAQTSGTNGTGSVIGAPSTVTVTDDDTPGITVTGEPASVSEGVGTFDYTVQLDSEPTANVVINLSATGCSVPASITLTSADWNTATNNITATVMDNLVVGSNPDCVITYAVDGASATEYLSVTEPNTTVTVSDDESPIVPPAPPADAGNDVGDANSPDAWDIQITSDTALIANGQEVTITITVRKLLGGTPVQVDFPVPNGFDIISATSNRGAVGVNGQLVTYTDDIHLGEVGITTILARANANAEGGISQACITTPVTKCATLNLARISQLPATGETPWWREMWVLLLVGVMGITVITTVSLRRR